MSRQYFTEPLWYSTADGTAIANSITETLVWTPAPTLDANYLQDARILRGFFSGKYSTTGAPTLRFRLRFGTATGGVVLVDTGAMTAGSAVTNAQWSLDVWLTVRSNGSAGTISAMGYCMIGGATAPTAGSATGAPAIAIISAGGITTPTLNACDFTVATAMSFTALWGTQSASNTLTGTNGYLLTLN
jgi:hypothetical protein